MAGRSLVGPFWGIRFFSFFQRLTVLGEGFLA
jgi:hypothetical protein